ncbi:MAG TPA: oxidoreductase [Xanthomonadales bacterium]|nr:oxidoreductase [Xanthomonadales bacterium]
MRPLRHAIRALRRELRSGELATLALALVLAVTVMTAVGTLVNRVTEAIASNAAELIGGDFGLAGRRPIDAAIEDRARALGLATVRMIEFPSVVFAGDRSQLAEIKAVATDYPLRGSLEIGPDLAGLERAPGPAPAPGTAYADARLLTALGLTPGDAIEFGDRTLIVTHRLHREPDSGSDLFQLAPRLLLNLADLEASDMLGPGSRASYRLMVAGPSAAVATFRTAIAGQTDGLRPISIETSQQQVRRAFDRAQRFLSLAALLAVLLAGVATALAANRFALARVDQVAVLRCLGAAQTRVLSALTLQLLLLAVPACLIGLGLGLATQAGLVHALGSLVPEQLPLPQARPALAGAGIGLILLLGFGLPPLLRLRDVPPMRVLNRGFAPLPPLSALVYVAALAATAVLTVVAVRDVRLAAIVLGTLTTLALAAALGGAALLGLLRRVQSRLRGAWRLGFSALARRRGLSVVQLVGLSLSLCALLLLSATAPALLAQWRGQMPEDTPNYFLLNVQSAQAEAVRDALAAMAVADPRLEPFATARLTAINGQPPTRRDGWNGSGDGDRPLNLSWRSDFPPANRLIAGRYWQPDSTEPEASIEAGWAERFGLTVGDRLSIRIGERDIEARVTSIRKADWDSFRVNFFVLLNSAAIGDAPHNLISSFHLPPGQDAELAALSRTFPNISLLDVDAILSRIREVVDRVSAAVRIVLGFSLAAGLLVLMAALQASAAERRYDSAVLRTLGARRDQLRTAVLVEFAALGGVAAALAVAGALIAGWLLAREAFDIGLDQPWPELALGAGVGTVLAMLAGWLGTRRILRVPPALTLRAG